MPNLYTRTGDKGETSLSGGTRISKGNLRVECYGTVDEMGSSLGFARSLSARTYVCEVIKTVQGRLFSLAGEIASDEEGIKKIEGFIEDDDVAYLEAVVDKCTEITGIQEKFVVPGVNPVSGALHMARTVVRRCERLLIHLAGEMPVRDAVLRYVNRLSDAVYALARMEETLAHKDELRGKVEAEVRRQMTLCGMVPFTLENIEKMAHRAREKADELNVPVVFAAVDEGGNTIILHRMENAFLGSIDIALNKAYTANAFRQPTHTLGESAIGPDAPLYGIENSNSGRIILFGGGFPYRYEGRVVGAIGVSGGTVDEDMAVARYALGNTV